MNEDPTIYTHRPFWQEVGIQVVAGLVAGLLLYLLTRRRG